MDSAAARAVVAELRAKVDATEIDSGVRPDDKAGRKPAINHAEAHARITNPLAFVGK